MFDRKEYKKNWMKEWRKTHPGSNVKYSKKWKLNNIEKNKEYDRKRNKRRSRFRIGPGRGHKSAYIKKEKIGVCNWCRNVVGFDCKRTAWHHDDNRYYDDISKNIIELCPTCHGKETQKILINSYTI